MGLKLHWFRAHVRIAKPKLHGPRTANVAMSSAPSTVAVSGFYHQRDFENAEGRMDLSTIHRSLSEVALEAQHGGAAADTPNGPKPTPRRPEDAVPGVTKPKMVNGEVMGHRDPPRKEGKRTANPRDDPAALNLPSRSQEETSNETTNPLFAMVGKKRATPRKDQDDADAEREETKTSRKDAKRNAAPERQNGGDQEATSSSNQEKKAKKKKEPKANVKKEAKQTKEFFKKKDKKAEKTLGGASQKPEPKKLPKVDPDAPTMRNPLLSYNTDPMVPRPAERNSNRNAVLFDEETDEEEFLRTGNIRVMAPKGPSLQGMTKVNVDRSAIDSYEDEEFDA